MSDFTQFLFVVQGNVIKNVPFQLGKCIPKGNLHAPRVGNLWPNSCHDSLVIYIIAIGRDSCRSCECSTLSFTFFSLYLLTLNCSDFTLKCIKEFVLYLNKIMEAI